MRPLRQPPRRSADSPETVQPFLNAYCTSCHGGGKPAAQFDLRQYTTAASVVQDFSRWNRVLARLAAREMPPTSMRQPSDLERQQVVDWIRATWAAEARDHDGDPGVVLARRLSNVEYNYTIRDLTGVDMRPTREFPVDPANTAGFDNSGESLTMSPALLNKYLQAARDVADHMVLTPTGSPSRRIRCWSRPTATSYCIQQIVDFYARQPTDYADYFQRAWRYEYRAALGQAKATLADVAGQLKVSAKYLAMVWHIAGRPRKTSARWRSCRPCGARFPLRRPISLSCAREGVIEMRDFVGRIRNDTALHFAAPRSRD